MAAKKINVKQIRSSNRTNPKQKATLAALGLGKIGRTKIHQLNAATVGMIQAVQHLVIISESK